MNNEKDTNPHTITKPGSKDVQMQIEKNIYIHINYKFKRPN